MLNENAITTRALLDLWLGGKKNRDTRRGCEYDIKCFLAFLLRESPETVSSRMNDINLKAITVEHIEAFDKHLEIRDSPRIGKPLARPTRIKRLKSLKSFLAYGYENNYLTFNAAEELLNECDY